MKTLRLLGLILAFVFSGAIVPLFAQSDLEQENPEKRDGLEKVVLSTVPAPLVVELFTSEGCSSCPAADAILGDLKKRQFVLPLSYHLDYWDYIGWKDRFSRPEFLHRQQAYAKAQGTPLAYTPQMVVAGALQLLGTDREAIDKALETAFTRNTMYSIAVARKQDGGMIARFPQISETVPAAIWLVTYIKRAESTVTKGENAGKVLIGVNVVRSIRKIGQWKGEAFDLPVVLTEEEKQDRPDAIALLANQADFGPIIAAAAFDYKPLPQ